MRALSYKTQAIQKTGSKFMVLTQIILVVQKWPNFFLYKHFEHNIKKMQKENKKDVIRD